MSFESDLSELARGIEWKEMDDNDEMREWALTRLDELVDMYRAQALSLAATKGVVTKYKECISVLEGQRG